MTGQTKRTGRERVLMGPHIQDRRTAHELWQRADYKEDHGVGVGSMAYSASPAAELMQ